MQNHNLRQLEMDWANNHIIQIPDRSVTPLIITPYLPFLIIPLLCFGSVARSLTPSVRTGRFKRKWRRRPTPPLVSPGLSPPPPPPPRRWAFGHRRDRRFKPPHEKFPSPLDRPPRGLDLYAFAGRHVTKTKIQGVPIARGPELG